MYSVNLFLLAAPIVNYEQTNSQSTGPQSGSHEFQVDILYQQSWGRLSCSGSGGCNGAWAVVEDALVVTRAGADLAVL